MQFGDIYIFIKALIICLAYVVSYNVSVVWNHCFSVLELKYNLLN